MTELDIRFKSTWRRRPLSPIRRRCLRSAVSTFSKWPFSSADGRMMVSTSPTSLSMQNGPSISCIFPFSILDISRTSSIRASRWLLDILIFFRQSSTRSGSWLWDMAMAVIPMIAFMGVRISWDIRARKLLFASLASLAAS